MCAEDPDAGFLPAPGRIALLRSRRSGRASARLGRRRRQHGPGGVRLDDREGHRARRHARRGARAAGAARSRDFDLVIEGGATNKGFLLDVLAAPTTTGAAASTPAGSIAREPGAQGQPGVRGRGAGRSPASSRIASRVADARGATSSPTPATSRPTRVPPSMGQQIDLVLRRRAVPPDGLHGRLLAVSRAPRRPRRRRPACARRAATRRACVVGERTLRLLYDVTDVGSAPRSRRHRPSLRAARPPATCARERRRWWSRST